MAYAPTISHWTKDVTLGTDYVTVWSASSLAYVADFYECVFQVNSNDLSFAVEANGSTVAEVDLEEIAEEYRLDKTCGDWLPIYEYEVNRWRFHPPSSITINMGGSLVMKLKANQAGGGTKKLERGFSVWGVQ